MAEQQTIPGYQPLNNDKVRLVTEAKIMEERTIRWIEALDVPHDQRWKAIAITHLQEAYMALVRSILQPGRVKLPEEIRAEREAARAEGQAAIPSETGEPASSPAPAQMT